MKSPWRLGTGERPSAAADQGSPRGPWIDLWKTPCQTSGINSRLGFRRDASKTGISELGLVSLGAAVTLAVGASDIAGAVLASRENVRAASRAATTQAREPRPFRGPVRARAFGLLTRCSGLSEEPLALGAIGLAVGAVLAAAAPRTRQEDEWLAAQFARAIAQCVHAVIHERTRTGHGRAKGVAHVASAVGPAIGHHHPGQPDADQRERQGLSLGGYRPAGTCCPDSDVFDAEKTAL